MLSLEPSRARRLPFLHLLAALAISALALTGCSGDDDSSDDDVELTAAFAVLGQADFSAYTPNRGGAPAAGTLAQPLGHLATDGVHLYIADTANNRVLGYNSLPLDDGAPADFVLGQPDFSSNAGGTAATRMALPSSAFIAGGKLVVADSGNNRVLIWNTLPSASGTAPDVVVGQGGFDSSASGVTQSTLAYPTSAIVAGNRLVVADQNNNRVLVWNQVPTTHNAAADLVLGQLDFVTRLADDEAAEMNRPSSVWSDGFRLLVADSGNNRVLYWTLFPQDSGADADYVLGQTAFSRSSAGVSSSTLRTPFGVASDGTRIYVADSGNNRVLVFNSFPIGNGVTASDAFGQDELAASTANDDDQDGDVDDNPTARTLNGPTGVSVYSGVVYVSDRNNNRLLEFPQ